MPSDEKGRGLARQSLVFGVYPDGDTLVECIDDSNRYPPVNAYEDSRQQFKKYDDYREAM